MRHVIIVLAAAAAVACGQPATDAGPLTPSSETETDASADAQALTAEGWGPLRIGMTRAEIEAALGHDDAPNAAGGAEPEACEEFHPARAPAGMLVMVIEERLSRISLIRDAAVETGDGFGLGASAADVMRAYGDRARAEPHKYQDPPAHYITVWTQPRPSGETYVEDAAARGVRYEIGGDGAVTAIHAGGPAIQLVEGCS